MGILLAPIDITLAGSMNNNVRLKISKDLVENMIFGDVGGSRGQIGG